MVHIQSFTFNPFQENTYVIWNDEKDAWIIDPGCYTGAEEKSLTEFIADQGLDVRMILNTHCHIDHVFGNKFCADSYQLPIHVPQGEVEMLAQAARVAQMYGLSYLESPEPQVISSNELTLGNEIFKVLHVPGHSPDHLAFYHSAQKIVLSGDVLFRQSIGRTDLPGGDTQTLLNSIRKVMFALPDDTQVYAGHMEPTTIGFEKMHNPFMR